MHRGVIIGFPEKQGVFHCRVCFCSKNNDHSKGIMVFQRSLLQFSEVTAPLIIEGPVIVPSDFPALLQPICDHSLLSSPNTTASMRQWFVYIGS